MTRLLLSAGLATTAFLGTPAVQACQLEYCSWAQPVCTQVDCSPQRPAPVVGCEVVAGRRICV